MNDKKGSRARSRPLVFALAGARMIRDTLPGRRRSMPAQPKRILVAHHLLLGDTIMLTPLLAKCRARWPAADIVMTCPVLFAPLYSGRPYGVRAVPYDPRDVATLSPLRATAPFDLALIPADNRLSWLARAARRELGRRVCRRQPPVQGLARRRAAPISATPMAWGDLVAGLVDGPPPDPYRVADWPAPAASAVASPGKPYCVLHAGASTPLKQWPASRWRALGDRLSAHGYAVVLSAGPGETALLDAIDSGRAWPRHAGTLSLAELWHVLAGAALVVCPDTGIAHLARLAGVPTVALFGPGSALLSGAGEFWRTSRFTALTIPDFPCRDQRITMKREVAWIRRCERFPGTGSGQCPEPRCMLALTDDIVWRASARHLGIAVD